MTELIINQNIRPWFVDLHFAYGQGAFNQFKEYLKGIPGTGYNGKPFFTWRCPTDVLGQVIGKAEELGYSIKDTRESRASFRKYKEHPEVLEHQKSAVIAASIELTPIRRLLTDEAGLGKTLEAIEICRLSRPQDVLVVCPAGVRGKWQKEFDQWWPERTVNLDIVSYNQQKKVAGNFYQFIIFDEIHHLQDNSSGFTRGARAIITNNPSSHAIGLTATIFPDRPRNLYSVVETLRPGSVGTLGQFSFRYTNPVEVEVGDEKTAWDYIGVRNEDELRARLASFSSRTTKQDVLHLLEMPEVRAIRVPFEPGCPTMGSDAREWIGGALNWACRAKIPHVVKWHEESPHSHKCIFVHHKDLVDQVASALPKGEVFTLTGSTNADRRFKIIEKTREMKKATIVATMHCIGEGLDLEHFQHALFAEIYWRPKTVIQAMNRFPRLNSKQKATIEFLIMNGTVDEKVAGVLLDKLIDINQLQKAGVGEEKLVEALGGVDETEVEEQIMQSLMGAFEVDGWE